MNEQDFYHKKIKPWSDKHGDISRVENAVELGMPDTNCAWGFYQFWLELKVIKGGKLYFERFQLAWMSGRYKQFSDGGMWVLAWDSKHEHLYMFRPSNVLSAIRSHEKKWITLQVDQLMNLITPGKDQFKEATLQIWEGARKTVQGIQDQLNGI